MKNSKLNWSIGLATITLVLFFVIKCNRKEKEEIFLRPHDKLTKAGGSFVVTSLNTSSKAYDEVLYDKNNQMYKVYGYTTSKNISYESFDGRTSIWFRPNGTIDYMNIDYGDFREEHKFDSNGHVISIIRWNINKGHAIWYEGEHKEFYPNGKLKVYGFNEADTPVGKWYYFNPKGDTIKVENN